MPDATLERRTGKLAVDPLRDQVPWLERDLGADAEGRIAMQLGQVLTFQRPAQEPVEILGAHAHGT